MSPDLGVGGHGTGQRLPVSAYRSQDWFDREQALLFDRSWQYAAPLTDLPADGSYLCVKAGRHPLVVLRDRGGRLRALHNTCRHRGSQILEGRGTVESAIVCPYHSWTYGLDGSLRGLPQAQAFEALDRNRLGLKPASVGCWNGLVFVHPNPEAPPLENWLGTVPERAGPHRTEALTEVSRTRYQIQANWKIFVENYLDTYHLWYLHSKSLGSYYDHARQTWSFEGQHWMSYEPIRNPADTLEDEMPVIDGFPEDQWGAFAHLLFPNFGIAADPTFWSSLHIQPQAPDHTIVELRLLGDRSIAQGAVSATADVEPVSCLRGKTGNDWKSGDLMAEDIRACEAVQRAMSSPAFEIGPLARPYEDALGIFQGIVLDYMESRPPNA